MRAKVDPDICIGCTLCTHTCPEVFRMENGISTVFTDPVPEEDRDNCRKAAEGCPVGAITIEE